MAREGDAGAAGDAAGGVSKLPSNLAKHTLPAPAVTSALHTLAYSVEMMTHILLDLVSGGLHDGERREAAQRALSELAVLLPSMRVQLGLLDSEERGFERN